MFFFILKKMMKSKWMVICLLAGTIFSVAMIASVPIYTAGVLQRLLTKDMESFQEQRSRLQSYYYTRHDLRSLYEEQNIPSFYQKVNKMITKDFAPALGLTYTEKIQILTIDQLTGVRLDPQGQAMQDDESFSLDLKAVSGMDVKTIMIYGEKPSGEMKEGVIEVMVTENTLRDLDLIVGGLYRLSDYQGLKEKIKVRITGVFTAADFSDDYWFHGLYPYSGTMVMDHDLFEKVFIDSDSDRLFTSEWYYLFDYTKLLVSDIGRIMAAYEVQTDWKKSYGSVTFDIPYIEILEEYNDRSRALRMDLWVLQVPVLIMLIFYMYIVSKLTIDFEKNEISVMQSRGAKRLWIFGGYVLESLIICIITFIPGLLLGLFMCRFMGTSNGFLEFVQRTALHLSIGTDPVIYGAVILAVSVLAMSIPAFRASKSNIVEFKRKRSILSGIALWKKTFIDFIMLGISLYGLRTYKATEALKEATGLQGTEINLDPLLFLSSTLFILGTGLLFLRIHPYLVRLIFLAGRKYWNPPLYAGLTQVSRSRGQEQFLMLFLILAMSVGIFSANATRTLNDNRIDKARYFAGADITLDVKWDEWKEATGHSGTSSLDGSDEFQSYIESFIEDDVIYIEPPFETFELLDGIETAAKVYLKNNVTVQVPGNFLDDVDLMAIIPGQFGKVAWFRDGLLPFHWYEYLNLMSREKSAMLLSSSFRDEYDVKVGDRVKIRLYGTTIDGVVYAFVDYWPTYNPHEKTSEGDPGCLVISNFDYIFAYIDIKPYEVWLSKESGAESEQIYSDLQARHLYILEYNDMNSIIAEVKSDPMLQGTNGTLTLGFIVSMGISLLGFLIYWILSIKKRLLQFGIFRAMGMSKAELVGILVLEQLLISGAAILAGIIIGGMTSELFVPLMQLTQSPAQQVPPFMIIGSAKDYIRIYIFAASMLAAGMLVLGAIIPKIKIHQVIKMGEE